jgi:hypothetical protein
MSEGTAVTDHIKNGAGPDVDGDFSTFEELCDETRFQFSTDVLEIPEVQARLLLRTLSVEERESLPGIAELMEEDKSGNRTEKAIKASAMTFSVIVHKPKLTPEQAEQFIGKWPAAAFDRLSTAYRKLVGDAEEESAAYATFPGDEAADDPSPAASE